MPSSTARSMIRSEVASSVCGPKFMVPRQMRLTVRPVAPRCVYFIVSILWSRQEGGSEGAPLGAGERGGVREEHLHAHVVGPGIEVRLHSGPDRGLVTPRDDRVDEAVAARWRQVVVAEPER